MLLYDWTANRPAGKYCYQVADDGKVFKKFTKGDIRPVRSKFCGHATLARLPHAPHAPNKPPELQPSRYNPVTYLAHALRSYLKSTPRTLHKEAQSLIAPPNTSADLLDYNRREFKSALQKCTERSRTPIQVSKKQRQGSDSDDSLFCGGDPASTLKDHLLSDTESPAGQRLHRVRSKNLCRLCHLQNIAGLGGLCIKCETTCSVAQPDKFNSFSAIQPVLPLKSSKTASPAPGVTERTQKYPPLASCPTAKSKPA